MNFDPFECCVCGKWVCPPSAYPRDTEADFPGWNLCSKCAVSYTLNTEYSGGVSEIQRFCAEQKQALQKERIRTMIKAAAASAALQ